jgi:hypothetical protein
MKILRKDLKEAFEDIQALAFRVRVDIDSPDQPSLQDVLTTLRGLPNVITVTQHGTLEDAPGGRQMANLLVKFEDTPAVDHITLRNQVERLPTVDLVTLTTVDGLPFDEELAAGEYEEARSDTAHEYQKKMALGKYAESRVLRNLIRELL